MYIFPGLGLAGEWLFILDLHCLCFFSSLVLLRAFPVRCIGSLNTPMQDSLYLILSINTNFTPYITASFHSPPPPPPPPPPPLSNSLCGRHHDHHGPHAVHGGRGLRRRHDPAVLRRGPHLPQHQEHQRR